VRTGERVCNKCGTALPEDSGFCHNCGAKVAAMGSSSEPESAEFLYRRAEAHAENEEYDQAVADYTKAISLYDPETDAESIERCRSQITASRILNSCRIEEVFSWNSMENFEKGFAMRFTKTRLIEFCNNLFRKKDAIEKSVGSIRDNFAAEPEEILKGEKGKQK
jgi:tetratricopeptide (TPR) repeat protein